MKEQKKATEMRKEPPNSHGWFNYNTESYYKGDIDGRKRN